MSDDVDGLIMEVEETHYTPPGREEGSVTRLNVGVELQVLGDVFPVQQGLFRPQMQRTLVRALLPRRGGISIRHDGAIVHW